MPPSLVREQGPVYISDGTWDGSLELIRRKLYDPQYPCSKYTESKWLLGNSHLKLVALASHFFGVTLSSFQKMQLNIFSFSSFEITCWELGYAHENKDISMVRW
jgi:hypothetical protein